MEPTVAGLWEGICRESFQTCEFRKSCPPDPAAVQSQNGGYGCWWPRWSFGPVFTACVRMALARLLAKVIPPHQGRERTVSRAESKLESVRGMHRQATA